MSQGSWRNGPLARALWHHKLLIYACYVILVSVATLSAWALSPRVYEVSSVISVRPGLYGDADKLSSARTEQAARSQVALLESESVIRRAVADVGASTLYPVPHAPWLTRMQWFTRAQDPPDSAYLVAKKSLAIRFEPFTDLIRVNFHHAKPELAVAFLNALVNRFTERYLELYSNVAAVSFFWEQQKRSNAEFARASAALAEFAAANQLYRIDEQQRLMLARRSELQSALLTTRAHIAEKQAQVNTIPGQLSQMYPVGRLPQVTGLTQRKASPVHESRDPVVERLTSDPPLLLVRVYQDTIASLVKLHTELAGLNALEANQVKALEQADANLSAMAAKEADFERLRAVANHAKQSAELFHKRALEEQLSQDLNAKNLSSVQVLQQATMPLAPVWPSGTLLLAVAFLLCIAPLLAGFIYRAGPPLVGSLPPAAAHRAGTEPHVVGAIRLSPGLLRTRSMCPRSRASP